MVNFAHNVVTLVAGTYQDSAKPLIRKPCFAAELGGKGGWEACFFMRGEMSLCPFSLAFDNRDVSVNRQIGETLHDAAGLRPFDLDPIDLAS